MNSKHKTAVKDSLKKLQKAGSGDVAFFFITDGENEMLHVSSKSGDASRFGDIDKINKHIKSKSFGEPFAKESQACAGKLSIHEGKLFFEIEIRKGAGPSDLKKGLKSLKAALGLDEYKVAEAPEGEEAPKGGVLKKLLGAKKAPRSQEELEASAEKIALDERQTRREQMLDQAAQTLAQSPETLSDDKLRHLLERIAAYTDAGGTRDFSGLTATATAEQERRERQRKREDALQQSGARFLQAPRTIPDDKIEQMLTRIRHYIRDGGTTDFSALSTQLTAERQRRAQFQQSYAPLQETSAELLEQSAGHLDTGKSLLERPLKEVSLVDLDKSIADLQRQRAALHQQLSTLQQLLAA